MTERKPDSLQIAMDLDRIGQILNGIGWTRINFDSFGQNIWEIKWSFCKVSNVLNNTVYDFSQYFIWIGFGSNHSNQFFLFNLENIPQLCFVSQFWLLGLIFVIV